jgi:hypothetical protein
MGLKLIPVARPLVALLAKNTRNSSVIKFPFMTAKNLLRNEFYSLDLWSLATKGTQELNLIWATNVA